ncbi:MAG: CocE/NonD family hydrolase [Pseudomonadota bacterium]
MLISSRLRYFTTMLVVIGLVGAAAKAAMAQNLPSGYAVTDVMIPMRDGARLNTKIIAPEMREEPLPIILMRTPYGAERSEEYFVTRLKTLADEGYIFVFQDIRGKFASEGDFVMLRPARQLVDNGLDSTDEATDTYDSIEWLLENIPDNNGRVGMMGTSYGAWLTVMAAIDPHPALKAAVQKASPADMWLGDDFYHNGAFRLGYAFEYAYMVDGAKGLQNFEFDRYDTYDWYLRLGPLKNVNEKYFNGKVPAWNDFVAHPNYDEFWKRQTMIPQIKAVKVPTLSVAGWWDAEDLYGPIRIYRAFEEHDTDDMNYLVAGPWKHGGWNSQSGDSLGRISFDSNTSKHYRDKIQAPWFAFYLKDKGQFEFPEAQTFEAGSNQWRSWDAWPPKETSTPTALYFGDKGKLSFEKPTSSDGAALDRFISDPASPVPYRHRPIQATFFPAGTSKWSEWLVEDQRFVDGRPDVLSWESETLAEDLTIAGEVVAHLYASTTGSDADWIVKLIDVYPQHYPENWEMAGYQLMVSSEVFRGRYRQSFEEPRAIEPNAVLDYTFSLNTQNYTFKKGHRILVQVQSSWFPIIDRNPQTFVPNIFEATESDFKSATHTIHRSTNFPSRVMLPIVTNEQR